MAAKLRDHFGVSARVMPHSVELPAHEPTTGRPAPGERSDPLHGLGLRAAGRRDRQRPAGARRAIGCSRGAHDLHEPEPRRARAPRRERRTPAHRGAGTRRRDPARSEHGRRPAAAVLVRGAATAVVSTSLPTKTADYLASGVPILVHAPPYASIALAAAEGGWAEVVTDPDPAALGRSLDRLASDEELRCISSATQASSTAPASRPCDAQPRVSRLARRRGGFEGTSPTDGV